MALVLKTSEVNSFRGFKSTLSVRRALAQFGRALALGARCRRFKSCRPDLDYIILQQLIMQIFLDTADINEIRKRWDTGIITGVTTNPTLVRKVGGNYRDLAIAIIEEFPEIESLSLELNGQTKEDFMRDMGEFCLHRSSFSHTESAMHCGRS